MCSNKALRWSSGKHGPGNCGKNHRFAVVFMLVAPPLLCLFAYNNQGFTAFGSGGTHIQSSSECGFSCSSAGSAAAIWIFSPHCTTKYCSVETIFDDDSKF